MKRPRGQLGSDSYSATAANALLSSFEKRHGLERGLRTHRQFASRDQALAQHPVEKAVVVSVQRLAVRLCRTLLAASGGYSKKRSLAHRPFLSICNWGCQGGNGKIQYGLEVEFPFFFCRGNPWRVVMLDDHREKHHPHCCHSQYKGRRR